MKKINIRKEFESIEKYWTQEIIGEANGTMLKLAKGIGEIQEVYLIKNNAAPANKLRHGTKLAEFHAGVGQARGRV